MFDRMLVLTAGLSADDRAQIEAEFPASEMPLVLEPLFEEDRESTVGDVVRDVLEGRKDSGRAISTPWPLSFFAVFPRSAIDPYIATFKKVVSRRGVYANLTETNTNWMVDHLVEHLGEEHDRMLELEAERSEE